MAVPQLHMCCVVLLWDALWHLCISCTPSLLFQFVRRQQVADGRSCEFDGEAVSVVFSLTVSGRASGCPLCSLSHCDLWIKRQLFCLLCYLGLEKSRLSPFLHFFPQTYYLLLQSFFPPCASSVWVSGIGWARQTCAQVVCSSHPASKLHVIILHTWGPAGSCLQLLEYWNHSSLASKLCVPALCGDSVFSCSMIWSSLMSSGCFSLHLAQIYEYAAFFQELHLKLVHSPVITLV